MPLIVSPFNPDSAYNDDLNDKPITSITLDSIASDSFIGTQTLSKKCPIRLLRPGYVDDMPDGTRAVEILQGDDLVDALDSGPRKIRRVRRDNRPL